MKMRGQHGFTLIELMLAMAISGTVLSVVVSGIFQIVTGTARINTDLIIQQDIDSASSWFRRDLSQAQATDVEDGAPSEPSMVVSWIDETVAGAASPNHCVRYYVEPGTTLLKRNYDGGSGTDCTIDGAIATVGRYVEDIQFSRSGKFISIAITSSLGERTQSLNYFVTPRPDGDLQ